VGQGCQIKLDHHHIYGENSFSQTFQNPKVFTWSWDAQRILRNHNQTALNQAAFALQHEAGMMSFETEDLLQQVELQQLQLQMEGLEHVKIADHLKNPWALFHWISIGISALFTFVCITIVAFCLRRYIMMIKAHNRTPSAPANLPALQMDGHLTNPQPSRGFFRIF
jgi:hypothetical protein